MYGVRYHHFDAPCTCSLRRSRRPCWYSTPIVFRAAGGRKSPRPSSIGYGRGLTVCRCRLTPRSLKFLECLETARMERPFIWLVRSSPEGKRYGDVTPATVTPVTSHVRGSSNALRLSSGQWLPKRPPRSNKHLHLSMQPSLCGRPTLITRRRDSNSSILSWFSLCSPGSHSSCTVSSSRTSLSTHFWLG